MDVSAGDASSEDQLIERRTGDANFQVDTPDVPLRFTEKKRLHWAGKTCMFLTSFFNGDDHLP